MNREILKAKIAEAISSTNTSGNEKLEAILAAVDTYSSAWNGTKPLVSGSLPLSFVDIVEKAENQRRCIDADRFNVVSCKFGYTVGFEDAQRIAVVGNDR